MATYTVRSGDSWERIAGYFGDQRNFYELMLANPGITRLHSGQVLRIPRFSSNPNVPNDVAAAMGMATTGQISAYYQAFPRGSEGDAQKFGMPKWAPAGWGAGGTGLGAGTTITKPPPQVAAGNRPGFSTNAATRGLAAPAFDPSVRGLGTPQTNTASGRSTGAVGGSRAGSGTTSALPAPQVIPTPYRGGGLPSNVPRTVPPLTAGLPNISGIQNPLNPQTWINAGQQFLPNLGTSMFGQTTPPAGAVVPPLAAAPGPQFTQQEMDAAFTRAQMGTASDADWRVIEQRALAQGFTPEEVAVLRSSLVGPQGQMTMPAPGNLFGAGGLSPNGVPGNYWNTPGPVPIYPDLAAPLGNGGGGGRRRGNAGSLGSGYGEPFSGLINWRYSG